MDFDFDKELKEEIGERVRTIFHYLKVFLRNPVQEIKHLPQWDWATVILLQLLAAASTGFVTGVLEASLLSVIWSTLLFPVIATVMTFIFALALHYVFLFVFSREVDFKKLFTLIILANIPYLIFRMASPFLAPLELIGAAFTGFLLVVGLTENFSMPRKTAFQIVGAVFALFFLIWLIDVVGSLRQEAAFRQKITPESLEVLEKEFKKKDSSKNDE